MTTSNAAVSIATTSSLTVANAHLYSVAQAAGGVIADDHCACKTIKLWGMGTLEKDGKQTPVALIDARYFSLNLVYLSKAGEAHLSINSVGGVIELHGAPVEDGVEQYNKEQAAFPFSSGQLTNVVEF